MSHIFQIASHYPMYDTFYVIIRASLANKMELYDYRNKFYLDHISPACGHFIGDNTVCHLNGHFIATRQTLHNNAKQSHETGNEPVLLNSTTQRNTVCFVTKESKEIIHDTQTKNRINHLYESQEDYCNTRPSQRKAKQNAFL